jgi:FAD/FMN-containing dehydrogenase
VAGYAQVLPVLTTARALLGSSLSAFEFMDAKSIAAVRRVSPQLTERLSSGENAHILPLQSDSLFCDEKQQLRTQEDEEEGIPGEVLVLIEVTGSDVDLDTQRVDKFVTALLDEGQAFDAVMSSDTAQERALWLLREHVPVSLMQLSRVVSFDADRRAISGKLFKYDVSVALQDTADFVLALKLALQADNDNDNDNDFHSGFVVYGLSTSLDRAEATKAFAGYQCALQFCNFGHSGDQNLHLNILARITSPMPAQASSMLSSSEYVRFLQSRIDRHVFRLIAEKKGD